MEDEARARRIAELFGDAIDLDPAGREAFLAAACGDDRALREEISALLAADAAADARGGTFTPSGATLAAALSDAAPDPAQAGGLRAGPWVLHELLGEGGMGRVYLASRDAGDFTQQAAVKVIRRMLASGEILARFKHERATLARLEHPGIARLLDGGATDDGLPWLAMELVEGEPLDAWCDGRRLPVEGRVSLMASIADAVAFAHQRLVVHRDLKPGNILVDASGAPHLLDFGVAKVLDDGADPGLTAEGPAPLTPAYASPEQVRGEPVGTAADVYALGVVLYELLTGRSPYRVAGPSLAAMERAVCTQEPERPSTAVSRVQGGAALQGSADAGPRDDDGAGGRPRAARGKQQPDAGADAPAREALATIAAARGTTPERLRRRLRGDLDRIVGKAMAKEPERRYASAAELADDLRRHLAGLPVAARAPTVGYRVSRFLRRHALASALTAALLVVLAAAAVQAVQSLRTDRARLGEILRLSDGYRLADLRAELDGPLWPAHPEQAEPLDAWIARARDVLSRLPVHRALLDDLRARQSAGDDGGDTRWWAAQLGELVAELDAFAADDAFGTTLAAGLARRAAVDALQRRTLIDALPDWERAAASIADTGQCPAYGGLALAPQWGLLPWRRDPASNLWEFVVPATGEPPAIDADGRPVIADDSALVLVLLPGGRFAMGAQAQDPGWPLYDPLAQRDEAPTHHVDLAPFFVSRTEMTQGQWSRVTGANPSHHYPPGQRPHVVTLAHPVEQVSFDEAVETLRRLGLVLPTEAQWEYAARAGTTTPWSTGDDPAALDTVANLVDLYARDHLGSEGWNYEDAERLRLDDGHSIHAPVGGFEPNAFGLHDVHGNLWEWCRDMPAPYRIPHASGDAAWIIPEGVGELGTRVLRGGAFSNPPSRARSAARWSAVRSFRTDAAGLRPARGLED